VVEAVGGDQGQVVLRDEAPVRDKGDPKRDFRSSITPGSVETSAVLPEKT
jgi:hypothetical protein